MKNRLLILMVTLIGFIFPQDCEEPINVWFKVSSADKDYGQIIQLDMSRGFATTDGMFIYLIVLDKNTREELVISFPIGHWISEKPYTKPKIKPNDEKKDFNWEEYLKNNKGVEIKKIAKVGD